MEKETKYYRINYSKGDEDLIVELVDYLDQKREDIFNFFDSTLQKEKVTINIIPTKKEYDEIAKKIRGVDEIPKWSIGFAYDDIINYVSLHDYKNTSHAFTEDKYLERLDYYKKTIVHEYVHFVADLYRKKNNIGHRIKYLNEGIATYLSGQKEDMEIPFNYKLEDILEKNNSYDAWYLLTKYIIEEYGKEYFLELFGNNEKTSKEVSKLFKEAKDYYEKKLEISL
jgi:hypothetical protein